MASGLLIDKPVKGYLDLKASEVENIVKELKNNLQEDRTLQETVVRYVTDNPAVTTAVAGIRTLQQLEDLIIAAKTLPLTLEEREQLQSLWRGNVYQEHR
jgi:predicted aldo/keto reductase-like oxidoreductase